MQGLSLLGGQTVLLIQKSGKQFVVKAQKGGREKRFLKFFRIIRQFAGNLFVAAVYIDQMKDRLDRIVVTVLGLPHFLDQIVKNGKIMFIIVQLHRIAAVDQNLVRQDQRGIQTEQNDQKYFYKFRHISKFGAQTAKQCEDGKEQQDKITD